MATKSLENMEVDWAFRIQHSSSLLLITLPFPELYDSNAYPKTSFHLMSGECLLTELPSYCDQTNIVPVCVSPGVRNNTSFFKGDKIHQF